ncbi:GAF domain-containing SpoIIE family protein phosphatase [Streptomyces sp. NPDC057950]|uniref:GAF domain-containing SpoIIE family protein phosphatase n=1 Tax=Streptomyces sp. NPDC057950 TaxID=3346288 RepID=UPI0036EB9130
MRETGLSAAADAGMDRFARLAADLLGAPVALVSLVDADRQLLPGMIGLDDPWASARQTPLTHSLCRHVVGGGRPLVIRDARADTRTRESLAIPDLGVVGYAGVPLTDSDGYVLGSLCVIDTRPRVWSDHDLSVLEDLAAACSAELRLRVVSRQRETARAEARELAGQLRTALDRSQLLLRAAYALADTTSLAEVRRQVADLVTGGLEPLYVGLVLAEGRRLRRLIDTTGGVPMEREYENYLLTDDWPTARAARENRTVIVASRAELERDYAPETVEAFSSLGLVSAVCVPLPGTDGPLGTLVLGWDHRHEIDVLEQAVLTALAGYTARAVERALSVDKRVNAARLLQEAMLTDLPDVPGVELAALYRPAAATDLVGGDWYDAYLLPSAAEGGENSLAPATLAVSVGDITGHDMHAATLMGQARSMLRQADLDHPGQGPARSVSAFEHANAHLRLDASGTLIHAHLQRRPAPDQNAWELTWTNAGHPPPLLIDPDGTARRLEQHGVMIYPGLKAAPRTEHRLVLPAGSLLLLYTDGLVEQDRHDIEQATGRTMQQLTAQRHDPLPTLLARLADDIAGPAAADDIALLALRVPGRPGSKAGS